MLSSRRPLTATTRASAASGPSPASRRARARSRSARSIGARCPGGRRAGRAARRSRRCPHAPGLGPATPVARSGYTGPSRIADRCSSGTQNLHIWPPTRQLSCHRAEIGQAERRMVSVTRCSLPRVSPDTRYPPTPAARSPPPPAPAAPPDITRNSLGGTATLTVAPPPFDVEEQAAAAAISGSLPKVSSRHLVSLVRQERRDSCCVRVSGQAAIYVMDQLIMVNYPEPGCDRCCW